MDVKTQTYLEKKTGAMVTYEDDHVVFSLHRAKIKLHEELEINLLKAMEPQLHKETILTEDLLTITCYPPSSYQRFSELQKKNSQSKWRAASNLLHRIEQHNQERIKLIICPENIMFDQGLLPSMLYYGVKESVPPYEDDKEQLWRETRGITAAIVDATYDFETYIAHHETMKISRIAKEIMQAKTMDALYAIIDRELQVEENYETTIASVTRKRWKVTKYITWGLIVLLVPTVAYGLFALFFKIPETQAYVDSNQAFLENNYSDVIDLLEDYDDAKMPYVVQYQLANAYLANQNLGEDKKKNIENTMTLQSDKRYFTYWINIGRGEFGEAVDTARSLESRDLIIYGLLKNREAIKADQSLDGEERESKVNKIDQEMDGYQKEIEEEEKAEAALKKEQEQEKAEKEEAEQKAKEENKEADKTNNDKETKKEKKADDTAKTNATKKDKQDKADGK